jgi:DNA-binding LacI/PurR family transcriptional regulator
MPQKITIREVAEEAGLSVSSVSRILNGGQGHVYPTQTHDRVREIAERLGYRANAAARLLRQNHRTLIGMSVYLTEHPHLNRFLVAVREKLILRGYDPVIFDSEQLSGSEGGGTFPSPQMLAGLISLGIDLEQDWPAHYAKLRKTMPIVAIQAVSRAAAEHVDVIRVDSESAYLQSASHLMELGHSRIAYLGPTSAVTQNDLYKFKGWKAAARHLKIDADYFISWDAARDQKSVKLDEFMSQSTIQLAVKAVAARWAAMHPRPTALICASDEVAICLQSYLLAQGYNLPRDLSIVGYDGISLGALVFPALTTVAPDYDGMTEATISRLMQLISANSDNLKKYTPHEQGLKPVLIMRDSTAPPPVAVHLPRH